MTRHRFVLEVSTPLTPDIAEKIENAMKALASLIIVEECFEIKREDELYKG